MSRNDQTDIALRLRAVVPTYEGTPVTWHCKVRSELLLEAAAEIERLRAEKDKLREEKEVLHVAVARIERAAAGAIYSQESIYVMASSALEALEAKP